MYQLHFLQNIPVPIEEAWDFFSSIKNLEKITPPALQFKIKNSQESKKIYSGQLISYTLKPLWNFPCEWITEITVVEKSVYFVDEQIFGPYAFWHHEHWFNAISGGTQIEDIIYYKLPFGILGKALHYLKIRKDLEAIFAYRKEALEAILGRFPV